MTIARNRSSIDPGVDPAVGSSLNLVVVRGVLTTSVRVSELPNGGVVHNFEVKTGVGGQRLVVPIAWHDPVRPPKVREGDGLVIVGSVRRRWFRSGGGSQSRTEVVAEVVAKAGSARAARGMESALAQLASAEQPPR